MAIINKVKTASVFGVHDKTKMLCARPTISMKIMPGVVPICFKIKLIKKQNIDPRPPYSIFAHPMYFTPHKHVAKAFKMIKFNYRIYHKNYPHKSDYVHRDFLFFK